MGLYFSKVFSFGNGADLDFVDLLYYLSNDPETDVILLYIEGLKENHFDALREILSQNIKPIVALKGGKSSTGSKAVKTHTASISGNNKLWSALLKWNHWNNYFTRPRLSIFMELRNSKMSRSLVLVEGME